MFVATISLAIIKLDSFFNILAGAAHLSYTYFKKSMFLADTLIRAYRRYKKYTFLNPTRFSM